MRSSAGKYFMGLDHIRALASFMVFTWHFLHSASIPHGYVPSVPCFSCLNEGHTGVALFMTLSGYLFAKLLDNQQIKYTSFIWNRTLRLLPLLLLVILFVGYDHFKQGHDMAAYITTVLEGIIKPGLPNGGWSITTEFHFYLLLPLVLYLQKRYRYSLLFFIAFTISFRIILYYIMGQIQTLSYWTIVGRIDQFTFGIIAYQFRRLIKGRHLAALGMFVLFSLFYWYFNSKGGFFKNPSYPSPSRLWIIIPTVEGLAYSWLISWYDNSFRLPNNLVTRFVAAVGTYSYSIYLLHYFFVVDMARYIHKNVLDISNFYLALLFSALCFLIMVPIGFLSFKFIESPFLKLRTKYIIGKRNPMITPIGATR